MSLNHPKKPSEAFELLSQYVNGMEKAEGGAANGRKRKKGRAAEMSKV